MCVMYAEELSKCLALAMNPRLLFGVEPFLSSVHFDSVIGTGIDCIYVFQVHHGVALSHSPRSVSTNIYTVSRRRRSSIPAIKSGGCTSRESGIPFALDIHEGTIVLSVRVGFTDAQQEGEVIDQDSTVILRRSTIRKYVFRARGRGWRVCTSTSGGGGGSAVGCVVPRDPLV